jgi:hypothetical protein
MWPAQAIERPAGEKTADERWKAEYQKRPGLYRGKQPYREVGGEG